MTVLAVTADHLAEYEFGVLTIARFSDGHHVSVTGKGIAGQFRACLKGRDPERVIATFIKMARGQEWQPLYKPSAMHQMRAA